MRDIILLDGGMGQELIHRAGDNPTPLWSTQVMLDDPGIVQAVHADYFAAGATVATANSYAVHRDRLGGTGLEERFEELLEMALAAARAAVTVHGSGRLAGSIGPLVATYRPELHPDLAQAVQSYGEVVRMMVAEVDLIIFETVASVAHAKAALAAARDTSVPVWLSVTVDDENGALLRSGEKVTEVACMAAGEGAGALLANCSAPEAMLLAMDGLALAGLPYGAYANGFEQITKDFLKDKPKSDALNARRDLGPEAYKRHVMQWVAHGATIVGGCCEVGPAHIASIGEALKAAGHRIV